MAAPTRAADCFCVALDCWSRCCLAASAASRVSAADFAASRASCAAFSFELADSRVLFAVVSAAEASS